MLCCCQALESSFSEAFDAVPDHGVITVTCALPSGGDVGDLWEAMEKADMQDKYLRTVAGRTVGAGRAPHALLATCR